MNGFSLDWKQLPVGIGRERPFSRDNGLYIGFFIGEMRAM
jgi:hypothetical protein